ncbi:peptide chain release factor N(5)-glutamine methyltransferase [Halobacillus litoralis]|uniref:peptide chain release factor N(5)-glutamine methyltransferase n=1 Tax=Halobacillus litoralis TaxID=45668 RepID=UPI001CFDC82A|nr:peptide chain release factor N(5)-glutamine methyltransferase [Halobacillus litoralis]
MQPSFTTIRGARRWASLFLLEHEREARMADLLLEYFLDWPFSKILAYETDPLPDGVKDSFIEAVHRHVEMGVPIQHLTGYAHFYGREFKVSSDVLIPRPETEELVLGLVEAIRLRGVERPRIVDLGTGSGVIAITAALELADSQVTAVDISDEALRVAIDNATLLQADVRFKQGDFLAPVVGEEFDVVVSNPPYISALEKTEMNDTVLNFDPELALFAEEEGLAAYRTILEQISTVDKKPWCIAFEIGHKQGDAVERLIHLILPEYKTDVRQDINGKDRMVFSFLG